MGIGIYNQNYKSAGQKIIEAQKNMQNAILDGKIPNEFSHAKKMMILLGNDLDL